jgi:CBS domain containing-hemolysin-like protein
MLDRILTFENLLVASAMVVAVHVMWLSTSATYTDVCSTRRLNKRSM